MTDLPSLLARLEAAEGASIELSALVMCALAAPAGSYVKQSPTNGAWCIFDGVDTRGRERLWEYRGWFRSEGWHVTSSLDAALALCERALPGWQWRIASTGFAIINPEGARDNSACIVKMDATTPALALCIAIVKALIVQQAKEAP